MMPRLSGLVGQKPPSRLYLDTEVHLDMSLLGRANIEPVMAGCTLSAIAIMIAGPGRSSQVQTI